jgi:hypothetical protein
MKLEDGTGQGFLAKVGTDNKVYTFSTTFPRIADVSDNKQQAYSFASDLLSSVPASQAAVSRVVNDSTTSDLIITNIYISYNGGDTNHNRAAHWALYSSMSAPSANDTAGSAENLNTITSAPADVTFRVWDGVGSGMTVASNGTLLSDIIVGQGSFNWDFQDSLIIAPTRNVGITVAAEEIGDASVTFKGYFVS